MRIEHVGEDGVGFGSDFDGAKMPAGLESAAELQTIVRLLRSCGVDEHLIEKMCFKNWLRVLRKTWGPVPGPPQNNAPLRNAQVPWKEDGEVDRRPTSSLRSVR
jgi:hypothetical protein